MFFCFSVTVLAEKIAAKKKKELAETAANFCKKAKTALERLHENKQKQESEAPMLNKLAKKYERMEQIAASKVEREVEKARKRRDAYLLGFQKLEKARQMWEQKEEEWKSQIMERRIEKDENAKRQKMEILSKKIAELELKKSKEIEIQRNLSAIKAEEEETRKKLSEKIVLRDQQIEALKMQKLQLEMMRESMAHKMRNEKIEKVDNPYALYERRIATSMQKQRKNMNSFIENCDSYIKEEK